ncbi:STM3941 family protein [Flavihumibacter profundi]|uniref:STM3941 family protein n=1 Tax=Flavihumibacter profundi TaxID=2716883 RepID=UPI001CC50DF3|nr:STM3941 family protein [Flavihumibacter profundi]MBZ5858365.1 hypothetical protein [Flavihumibacter profundi]
MSDTIQLTYNKVFAYLTLSMLSIVLFIFVIRTFQLSDPEEIAIMRYFDIFMIVLIIVVCIKYFIPAIKGQIALELNKDCLVDNIRNRKVYWSNVQNVRQVNFSRSFSSGIAIDLIDKDAFYSDQNMWQKLLGRFSNFSYNTPFIIPLQYISGDNTVIFETLKKYFEVRAKSE